MCIPQTVTMMFVFSPSSGNLLKLQRSPGIFRVFSLLGLIITIGD